MVTYVDRTQPADATSRRLPTCRGRSGRRTRRRRSSHRGPSRALLARPRCAGSHREVGRGRRPSSGTPSPRTPTGPDRVRRSSSQVFHGRSQAVRGHGRIVRIAHRLLIGIGCARSRPRSAPGSRSDAGCVARGSGRCVRDDQLRRDLPVAEAICDQAAICCSRGLSGLSGTAKRSSRLTQGDIASVRASGTAARQRSWQRPGLLTRQRPRRAGSRLRPEGPACRPLGTCRWPGAGPAVPRSSRRAHSRTLPGSARPAPGRSAPPPPTTYRPRYGSSRPQVPDVVVHPVLRPPWPRWPHRQDSQARQVPSLGAPHRWYMAAASSVRPQSQHKRTEQARAQRQRGSVPKSQTSGSRMSSECPIW